MLLLLFALLAPSAVAEEGKSTSTGDDGGGDGTAKTKVLPPPSVDNPEDARARTALKPTSCSLPWATSPLDRRDGEYYCARQALEAVFRDSLPCGMPKTRRFKKKYDGDTVAYAPRGLRTSLNSAELLDSWVLVLGGEATSELFLRIYQRSPQGSRGNDEFDELGLITQFQQAKDVAWQRVNIFGDDPIPFERLVFRASDSRYFEGSCAIIASAAASGGVAFPSGKARAFMETDFSSEDRLYVASGKMISPLSVALSTENFDGRLTTLAQLYDMYTQDDRAQLRKPFNDASKPEEVAWEHWYPTSLNVWSLVRAKETASEITIGSEASGGASAGVAEASAEASGSVSTSRKLSSTEFQSWVRAGPVDLAKLPSPKLITDEFYKRHAIETRLAVSPGFESFASVDLVGIPPLLCQDQAQWQAEKDTHDSANDWSVRVSEINFTAEGCKMEVGVKRESDKAPPRSIKVDLKYTRVFPGYPLKIRMVVQPYDQPFPRIESIEPIGPLAQVNKYTHALNLGVRVGTGRVKLNPDRPFYLDNPEISWECFRSYDALREDEPPSFSLKSETSVKPGETLGDYELRATFSRFKDSGLGTVLCSATPTFIIGTKNGDVRRTKSIPTIELPGDVRPQRWDVEISAPPFVGTNIPVQVGIRTTSVSHDQLQYAWKLLGDGNMDWKLDDADTAEVVVVPGTTKEVELQVVVSPASGSEDPDASRRRPEDGEGNSITRSITLVLQDVPQ